MPLNIKSAKTDRLVRELASLTGESITEAVTKAVAERLDRCREQTVSARAERAAKIDAIVRHARSLPVFDDRSPDEILEYNEKGHWD
jgi:antitoxin VapB